MTGSEAQDHGHGDAAQPRLEGATFTPTSLAELRAALEEAFEYRGDVTLGLRDGTKVTGYVFNRDWQASQPAIDLYTDDASGKRRLPCADIATVGFSGRDMASGRSFEAWVTRWNAKKAALAEGRDIGDIEPTPTHLE